MQKFDKLTVVSPLVRSHHLLNTVGEIIKNHQQYIKLEYSISHGRSITLEFNCDQTRIIQKSNNNYTLKIKGSLLDIDIVELRKIVEKLLSTHFDLAFNQECLETGGYYNNTPAIQWYEYFKHNFCILIDTLLFTAYVNKIILILRILTVDIKAYKTTNSIEGSAKIENSITEKSHTLFVLLDEFIQILKNKATKYYQNDAKEIYKNFAGYTNLLENSNENMNRKIDLMIRSGRSCRFHHKDVKSARKALKYKIVNNAAIDVDYLASDLTNYYRDKLKKISDKKSKRRHYFFSQINPLELKQKELADRTKESEIYNANLYEQVDQKKGELVSLESHLNDLKSQIDQLDREIVRVKAKNKALGASITQLRPFWSTTTDLDEKKFTEKLYDPKKISVESK